MPQSGTGVSVEAVDPVFQTKMLDMLKQTGRYVEACFSACFSAQLLVIHVILILDHRPEMVVGWYHSHPGFGCWLSGVDVNTQQVSPLDCRVFLASTYFSFARLELRAAE